MSNLAIVSTPFVLLDLYGVTVTYSEIGKQKGGGGRQFYDMRVKAIVQPFYILGRAHGVKKYDFFIKEEEQMTGISQLR
jgi:hypothetical protein